MEALPASTSTCVDNEHAGWTDAPPDHGSVFASPLCSRMAAWRDAALASLFWRVTLCRHRLVLRRQSMQQMLVTLAPDCTLVSAVSSADDAMRIPVDCQGQPPPGLGSARHLRPAPGAPWHTSDGGGDASSNRLIFPMVAVRRCNVDTWTIFPMLRHGWLTRSLCDMAYLP